MIKPVLFEVAKNAAITTGLDVVKPLAVVADTAISAGTHAF